MHKTNKEKRLGTFLFLKLKFSNIIIICTIQNINSVQVTFEYLLLLGTKSILQKRKNKNYTTY
jgi:succinate-acetate transporter protein